MFIGNTVDPTIAKKAELLKMMADNKMTIPQTMIDEIINKPFNMKSALKDLAAKYKVVYITEVLPKNLFYDSIDTDAVVPLAGCCMCDTKTDTATVIMYREHTTLAYQKGGSTQTKFAPVSLCSDQNCKALLLFTLGLA